MNNNASGPVFFSDVIGVFAAANQYHQAVLDGLPAYDRLLVESPDDFLKTFKFFLETTREGFRLSAPLAVSELTGSAGDMHYAVGTPWNTLFYISLKSVRGSFPGVASAG